MKLVRDRADARWLPSRFRFAVFRLIAWAIYRSSGPRFEPGLVLGIDRDQSAIESYSVAIWLVANWTCFVHAGLEGFLPWPVALFAAFVVAVLIPQVFVVVPGLGSAAWRQQDQVELNSFITMFAPTVAALYFAGTDRWVGVVAWLFLGVLMMNAAAAIVVRLFRARIVAAEQEVISG